MAVGQGPHPVVADQLLEGRGAPTDHPVGLMEEQHGHPSPAGGRRAAAPGTGPATLVGGAAHGSGDHGAVRSSLDRHRSRRSRASSIHDPGPVTSAGMSRVSRAMSGGRLDSRWSRVTSGLRPAPGMVSQPQGHAHVHPGVLAGQRGPVHGPGRLHVLAQLARERPHGVLHVHGRLAAHPAGGDVLQRGERRRPRQRGQDPAVGLVLQPVEVAGPRLQVAAGQALGQADVGRTVPHRGDGDHPVGQAAAVGQVEVPGQSGVVSVGQEWASTARGRPTRMPRPASRPPCGTRG